jgi:hypothetical protein
MWGMVMHHSWRQRIEEGELVDDGDDFIKVCSNLRADVWQAIHSDDPQTELVVMDGLVVAQGEEVSTDQGHAGALGIDSFIEEGMSFQETIDAVSAAGGVLQVNHPTRQEVRFDDIDGLVGLWGMEIRNGSDDESEWDVDEELWDRQISQGKRLWGTFSDDAHDVDAAGRGWLMVATTGDCTLDAVMSGMRAGAFYASQGPSLEIQVDDDTITVTSESASQIEWYREEMTLAATTDGAGGSYTALGEEVFVRAVVTDGDGEVAMTMPIFLR